VKIEAREGSRCDAKRRIKKGGGEEGYFYRKKSFPGKESPLRKMGREVRREILLLVSAPKDGRRKEGYWQKIRYEDSKTKEGGKKRTLFPCQHLNAEDQGERRRSILRGSI